MNYKSRFLSKLSIAAAGIAFLAIPSVAFGTYLDFTDIATNSEGSINGADFYAYDNSGSVGTGTIQSFVRWQGNGETAGYNTDGDLEFDTKTSIWTHSITIGNLVDVGGYFEFFLDINQQGNANSDANLLSLQNIQLFVTDNPNITDYNNTSSGDWGNKIYDMDGAEDSLIDLNASISSGSGNGFDMMMAIKTDLFSSFNSDQYVVLYTSSGGNPYGDNDGFQEWKSELTTAAPVPEPATLLLFGTGLIGLAGMRHRKKK